jgi:hypothetical protein
VANRPQVFQIETKKTHELSISNQTINALRLLNVRTSMIHGLFRIAGALQECYSMTMIGSNLHGAAVMSGD